MDKESHPDLSHANLNYQNNNFSHSNSLTNYQNSTDRSHLQQQYSGNSSQQVQHVLPPQVSDSARCTSEGSCAPVVPGSSSLSPRLAPSQGSVYMTAQSSQGLNTYSEANKPPNQSFFGLGGSAGPSNQGGAAYVPQTNLQSTSSAGPGFNAAPGYHTSMTNSTVQNTSSGSSSATDLEKRQLIQQQLLLLLHAQCCRQEQTHATPCTTPHCRTMRNVLQHMKNCTEGKNCRKPHCASSRQIISHWKNCSSRECPVCGPLRRSHQQRTMAAAAAANQRPPGGGQGGTQVIPSTSQPSSGEMNGVSTPMGQPPQLAIRSPVPQNVRRPVQAPPTTSTPQVKSTTQPPYSQQPPVPNSNLASSTTQPQGSGGGSSSGGEGSEQADWRTGINSEHRDHVVRRIVKYILPQPDPAAYSDPRMTNLIEYAKKVENATYNIANSRPEYFQLLSERCYKIYKELEEARRRRKNAATSGNGSTSLATNDSTTSASNVSTNSVDSSGGGMTQNLGSVASSGAVGSSTMDFKQEQESFGSVKKEEDIKPSLASSFIADSNKSSTSSLSKDVKVKTEDSIGPIATSSASLNATSFSDNVKIDESKWKKWSREELLRNFLCLHEEVYADKNAEWFRDPVDPVALNIPDYLEVIEHPMDLSTIRNNLEDGVYKDPWEVLNDFRLMFNNAWLYNKKNSKVYKMCTKLSELFESRVDQVMQAMGFCCGHEYSYQQILYCSSANVCTIGKDAFYYMYTNTDKSVLICDTYYQCEKCFNEAGDEILLADEVNQAPVPVRKELFERKKNNVTIEEAIVYCKECGRRWHKVCALHMDEIWPNGFVCPGCLREHGQRRKENRFTAKNLPTNKLSNFLERRVNDFLKKKEVGSRDVTIRVLASSDKTVEVKPLMRNRFTESGELSESFPYRLKAIFAFQEIDGQDVCFFGLYIQEYGSESPQPNRRRVYVAYLDSVFYFRPKQYRTDVYHEILVGYLHYAKQLGYTMAHIWACPPAEGDDYIFHMHPVEQRIPKAKRLQDWYKRMLQKAMIEGIVADFKDILKDAIDHHLVSPTEIPYFEGDFWPNTLEEILQDLDKEEERRRREEALAETEDDEDGSRDRDGSHGDLDKRSGKKKAKKRKFSKKAGGSMTKRKKADGPVDCNTELTRKVYDTMEKLKEIFFVIRLHKHATTASLPPISDPDALISSELMDSRDSFLQMAREKHLEFSSLRRAKYSTLVMLYELHNEGKQSFLYTCNVCKDQIETRWHCNECDEYDLCNLCYKTENHPHPMEQYGLGIEEEGSNSNGESGSDRPSGTAERKPNFLACIAALIHANMCRDANCRNPSCIQMKKVLAHLRSCPKRSSGTCPLCRQLISMCCMHAKSCTKEQCQVPLCPQLKDRLRQQQLQKRRQQTKSLQRRTNLTRGATIAADASTIPSSSYHPQYGGQASAASVSSANPDISSPMSRNSSFSSSSNVNRVGSMQNMSLNGGPMNVPTGTPRALSTPSFPPSQGQQQTRIPASQGTWTDSPLNNQSGMSTSQPNSNFRTINNTVLVTQQEVVPTQEQLNNVRRVLEVIRSTPASQEEQNRQFMGWLSRHPDYRPAYDTLRNRGRQAAAANQQRLAAAQQANAAGLVRAQRPQTVVQSSSPAVLSYNVNVESTNSVITPQQHSRQVITGGGVGQRQFVQQQFAPQITDQQQQQQYVIAQPMRVRTLPGGGGGGVIQQQQNQHPGDQSQQQQRFTNLVRPWPGSQQQSQQMYSNNSPVGGVQSSTVYTGGNSGGTALLTTIGGGSQQQQSQHHPQHQVISQSRILSGGQRVVGGQSTAAVVHLRTAAPQQQSQPQHILVTNPVTSTNTSQSRPVVTMMQQQQPPSSQPPPQPPSSNNPSGS
ncbi:unnamed protein product [Hymenolepis diminuta]|uniref:histone acetyltransferase n=1 Tax=Hymenolepis diminuta TaxID=6216 RepID=A0A0R3SQY9_HYMDI|nr:unnamed protein product [Hymenolepis diminuta]VUZ41032.1 unnamed protein product [Hymenolepis diminuta]